jgi:hypothetical protein
MIKAIAALTLLLVSAGSAFGATADFIFLNKLALLIGLNIVLGGLLTLCAAVIASHLWDKVRQGKRELVRVRAGRPEKLRQPNQRTRSGVAESSRRAINE